MSDVDHCNDSFALRDTDRRTSGWVLHDMGTLGYMSPEQLRGGEVDQRTDIFALAVMLIEVLKGEAPLSAMDP